MGTRTWAGRTAVAALALALGLVAACASEGDGDVSSPADEDGGEDGNGAGESEGGGEDSSEDSGGDLEVLDDPRSDAERDADEAAAAEIVLTLDDMPAGFTEGEPQDADEDESMLDPLAECLGVDRGLLDPDNPEAKSPEFDSVGGSQVSVEVSFRASPEHAGQAFDLVAMEATPGCYAETLTSAITGQTAPDGSRVEVGEVTFEPLSFPDLGDQSTAFRVSVPLSAQGQEVEVFADVAAVRVGRVVVSGTFLAERRPFDTDVAAGLVETMVDRVPAGA